MTFKKALFWTAFWVAVALIFNAGVLYFEGHQKALEFFTGYIIELSLSMDNVFLFLMIFTMFGIKAEYQRRALNYGIIGAIIMRLIFILLGVSIITRFEWVLYIFGGILIITALKIIFGKEEEIHPEDNKLVILFKKFFPVTTELYGDKFFVRLNGILHATPLFIVVLVIESSDLLFAIDSIPAIFAVTTDPFIIYTSNILAILGLRSLYFFMERIQQAFVFIKQGVGVILFITGVKMLLLIFHIKVPILVALSLIVGVLVISIILSLLVGKRGRSRPIVQEKGGNN
ncbi:TerC/Alx family metal homeostasis membrane protein [Thermincola potens]|uniref:Integral membrane protein TerC n=1 Tax=Thermincola potens (strain JR) TaxID=635013 RepID=D5XFB6_THEPJ|nr:TerC/Alx family metal homeostasis membrane protein [Thermincola potens]ADG82337.1 Integral membrane protein TerC [Thermincola potens JR]